MKNQKRIDNYIEEVCTNCKHKNEDLCEIRLLKINDMYVTKCAFYERDKKVIPIEERKLKRTAKIQRAVMPELITNWRRL